MYTAFILVAAEHGDASSRYFQHFGVALLLTGILCLLLGLVVGWFAWRYCQRNAARMDAENLRLEDELKKYQAEVKSYAAQIDQFSKN